MNSSTAVVILNWNGKHFLEKFVPILIEKTSKKDGTIFIADNGSTDGSIEWLKDYYPEVRLIIFDKNYGFTGGYNRAFKEIAEGRENFKYYLLLNSDVEVTENWLRQLNTFMEEHPKAGICSPKVLSYDKKEYFEHAGACGGYIDRFGFPFCQGRVLSKVEKDQGQYNTPREIFWASGTSFMVRTELWQELRGLDENFFAHMEEIDMCWRAQLIGWQIWVCPASHIYHVGGGTLPNNSPRKLYLNFRNNLLMLYKNLPEKTRGWKVFIRMCIDGMIGCAYLLTGKFSFFQSVIKAHRDFKKMKKEVTISQKLYPVSFSHTTLIQERLKIK